MSADSINEEHEEKLESILQSNQYIRNRIQQSVNKFLMSRQSLIEKLQIEDLKDLSHELAPLIDAINVEALNRQVTSDKVQLVLCGENSSGKTSFIHLLLGIGDILPADVGPVTARTIKLTYAKAEEACVLVYQSFEASYTSSPIAQIDLSKFFVSKENDESAELDWGAIGDCLSKHVQRPSGMDIKSQEFSDWAKHFIELRLPSQRLKLGIDVYDTAGFRIRDAQVLKDNLFALVRQLKPTIVFLYDNPSGTDETHECFLELKKTLKHLEPSNIFFLNTKVDVAYMNGMKKTKTKQQFLDLLARERTHRYNLLLKTPGMSNAIPGGLPKSFDQCHCFDICSSHSEESHRFGPVMNKIAIERLVQFVANSDLIMAQRVSNLVVPAIEAFFDLILITSHRTKEQLKQLKKDAHHWIENYFHESNRALNRLLEDIFQNIFKRFSEAKDDLARRACQQTNLTDVKSFIQLAIQHEIMKSVVYDAQGSMSKNYLDSLINNQNLIFNATSNEILITSLKTSIGDCIDNLDEQSINRGILRSFIIQTFTRPLLTVTDLLFDEQNDRTIQPTTYSRGNSFDANQLPEKNFDFLPEAKKYLADLEQQIISLKDLFIPTIAKWSNKQKDKIISLIDQQHKIATDILPIRQQVHDILQHHILPFLRIECELKGAQDLAKFNGMTPTIRSTDSPSTNTIYVVEPIEWASKTDHLFVKHLADSFLKNIHFSYFEAHYHRKITNLNIPNTVKLTYLYVDNQFSVWMIFEMPVNDLNQNLHEFIRKHTLKNLSLSLKEAIQLLLPILNALTALHENELVHGNLTAKNILLDDQNQTYLADLGDWSPSKEQLSDNVQSYHQVSTERENIKKDIADFGLIGLLVLEIVTDEHDTVSNFYKEYQDIMESCRRCSLKTEDIRHAFEKLLEKLK